MIGPNLQFNFKVTKNINKIGAAVTFNQLNGVKQTTASALPCLQV